MEQYILTLDQGTTSSRAILFNKNKEIVCFASRQIELSFPHIGYVEIDPMQLWVSIVDVINEVITKSRIKIEQIASIGITNQRETTIVINKNTGVPIYNAIIWQSRQSNRICEGLIKKGYTDFFKEKTGLVISPYFSATKLVWILDNVEGARELANQGDLLFLTVDSWLIYKLTNGEVHATDYSNASRTMLYNIKDLCWDQEILKLLNIPKSMLPTVYPSSFMYGYATNISPLSKNTPIKITGVVGDQQASLFGHCCFEKGQVKNTYGTGCFLLMNTGDKPFYTNNGLVTTIAWGINDKITYALEGSIFTGGSVIKWLKENLEVLDDIKDSEKLALSIKDTDGVYFVPSFAGLGAPYWDSEAKASILGLTLATKKAQIIRAALESIAYQSKDVVVAMEEQANLHIIDLAVDGGASNNDFLLQFQSDILNCNILKQKISEATSLGAAYLAGLQIGFFNSLDELIANRKIEKVYKPKINKIEQEILYKNWKVAIKATQEFK